jgi:uncharacterized membrane protein (Fun14 family)
MVRIMGDDQKKSDAGKGGSGGGGQQQPQTFVGSFKAMPAWKKGALIVAALVMALGLGMQLFASATSEPAPAATASGSAGGGSGDLARGFAPTEDGPGIDFDIDGEGEQPAEAAPEDQHPMEVYSPAIFRLGFSFFVGLAVAHALRTLMKATLIGAGFLILGLMGLEYADFITVNWTLIEERYETFGAWAGDQFESMQAFATGALPSVGAASVGAVMGFKRK